MSKKKLFTRKAFLIVIIALLFSANVKVASAGSLNGNEAAVVSAAQGTFDYNGIKYQTDPVFIQQLVSYLSQDDVDLDTSQKDEAISMMFSNIGQGVAEGYLIPLSGQDELINSGEQIKDEDQEEELSNNPETNSDAGEDKKADITGNDSSVETSDKKEDLESNEQSILNEIRKQPATKTVVDQNINKVTVKKEDNSSVIVVNTVIKNTGFNLSSAFTVFSGLFIAFLFCVVITVRCNFFRQEEQER